MPTPLNKGIRDFSRPVQSSVFTYTQTNDTTTQATQCSTTFSDKFSSKYTSFSDCTKTTTNTIPTRTITTIGTTTGTQTCTTCKSTINTYPPTTTQGTFTETIPKWRPIENKNSFLVENAIPWHPLGVCGLAKWFMADKGHPAWGVKKKIHLYDDDATEEYQGALEQTGILEAGVKTDAYENYFSEGKIASSISAISNKVKIFQGMEGFISGAFLWRYNHHNPFEHGFTPLFSEIQDKWTQEVDGAVYPTDWLRVRVQGVRLNEDGDITEIALVTKYGTGINPVWGIRENSRSGSLWTNSASVLTEPSCTLGYEGHIALVPLARLFEFNTRKIFHFIEDVEKNDVDYDAVAIDIGSNVGNSWTYPLTLDENKLPDDELYILPFAEDDKQDGVRALIKELDRNQLQPKEPLYNIEDAKEEIKDQLKKAEEEEEILAMPIISNPVGDASTPTTTDRFRFWEYYPNIWRLNSNIPTFSESNYPYVKYWNIGGTELPPQFRITHYKRYAKNQNDTSLRGVDYIRRAIDPNKENIFTWTAWKEYTWQFTEFGTEAIRYVLGHPETEFLHDFQTANIQTIKTNDSGWSTQSSFSEEETLNNRLDFYFKASSEELIIGNIGVVFNQGHKLNLRSNLRDQAIIPLYNNNIDADAIFVFEFPPYNRS